MGTFLTHSSLFMEDSLLLLIALKETSMMQKAIFIIKHPKTEDSLNIYIYL